MSCYICYRYVYDICYVIVMGMIFGYVIGMCMILVMTSFYYDMFEV